jgi:nicotinamidase-related amidase
LTLTLNNVTTAIQQAQQAGDLVVLIQHVADPAMGIAPFFNEGTDGADLHPRIRELALGAPVVVKAYADGFVETHLESLLAEHGIQELLVCGMMTQNCVTHGYLTLGRALQDVHSGRLLHDR